MGDMSDHIEWCGEQAMYGDMSGDSEGAVAMEEMAMSDAEELANEPAPAPAGGGLAAKRAARQPTGTEQRFDPMRYLTKVGAGDYLEVKWRLVWFRNVYPQGTIETELVSHVDQMAVFKATALTGQGGKAVSYGSEGINDFREYLEKAETKAIGRALGALGFGTQFSYDFAEDANVGGGIADSPVNNPGGRNVNRQPPTGGGGNSAPAAGGANGAPPAGYRKATDKQIEYLKNLATDADIPIGLLEHGVRHRCKTTIRDMPSLACSQWIKMLKEGENGGVHALKAWCDEGAALANNPTRVTEVPGRQVRATDAVPIDPATGLPVMSDEAARIWETKIANSTTVEQLEAINATLETRHGVIREDVEMKLIERFSELDPAASVPY